jgi:hypothetical protein
VAIVAEVDIEVEAAAAVELEEEVNSKAIVSVALVIGRRH